MFTEIEALAIWKQDIVRKDNKMEIEISQGETQEFTIKRKKEDMKKDTNISQVTESAANAQKKERNMKI